LPGWAEAVGQRLVFFAAPSAAEVGATLIVLRERVAVSPDSARLLRRFLDACLAIFATEVARRADLAEHRAELDALCDLARAALDGDRDDRPLLARVEALLGQPGPVRFIARVPSRVVWLAAMAAEVPSEEGPAAAMLVNDLAALGLEMPLRALQAVLRD
jgi:hypothetical protein